MKWIIAGLGNPGKEYEGTRHNVGRDLVAAMADDTLKKTKVLSLDTYMNDSGRSVKKAVTSMKAAEKLLIVHDDLDLPLGRMKLSFGSGAGGHKGVESIQKALKTKNFARLRIGISPATPGGKLKKPSGDKVIDFVLGKFRGTEQEKLKKMKKTAKKALEAVLSEGLQGAMTEVNSN